MSTHARPLADWLAAASDDDLEHLFAARGIRPDVRWLDLFDAAEALLDPASLAKVLPTLTAAEARALRAAAAGGDPGSDAQSLIALALLRVAWKPILSLMPSGS